MNISIVSDHARHELGCAAALKEAGHDVTYVNVGSLYPFFDQNAEETSVSTGASEQSVPIVSFPKRSSFYAEVVKIGESAGGLLKDRRVAESDVVICTLQMPWYLSKIISRELKIPVIAKIHTTRITKSRDYSRHGMRKDILTLAASVSHCSLQLALSSRCMAMDAVSMRTWQTMIPFKRFSLVYPTYAAVYDQRFSDTTMNQEVSRRLETLRGRPCILSVIGCRKGNPSVDFEIQALDIMVRIAKENPEVTVVVVGTSMDDARGAGYSSVIPRNLIFMGRFYSDILLREVYRTALMVVCPVMATSISNRLNEALFYGKAIVTNSTSKRLHPELIHAKNIIISDEYWRYGQIVRELLANPDRVRDLADGAAECYERHFSSKRCAVGTIEAIKTLGLH